MVLSCFYLFPVKITIDLLAITSDASKGLTSCGAHGHIVMSSYQTFYASFVYITIHKVNN